MAKKKRFPISRFYDSQFWTFVRAELRYSFVRFLELLTFIVFGYFSDENHRSYVL